MAQLEQYFFRNQSYSSWHRGPVISRYIDSNIAMKLTMQDIDNMILDTDSRLWFEYDPLSSLPLALFETAVFTGNGYRRCTPVEIMAKNLGVFAYVVLYELSDEDMITIDGRIYKGIKDIQKFYRRRLWPSQENEFREMSCGEYANFLVNLRDHRLRINQYRRFINDQNGKQKHILSVDCNDWNEFFYKERLMNGKNAIRKMTEQQLQEFKEWFENYER